MFGEQQGMEAYAERNLLTERARLYEEVKRLSAEVETWRKDAIECGNRVAEMHKELAALRAQIAEAQPVGHFDWSKGKFIFDQPWDYSKFNMAPLYAHPAADAKDAARYRWLRDGCNEKNSTASRIAANKYGMEWDSAIDAAMKGEK